MVIRFVIILVGFSVFQRSLVQVNDYCKYLKIMTMSNLLNKLSLLNLPTVKSSFDRTLLCSTGE